MRATDVEDGRGRSSANVAGASVVGPAAPTASAAVVLRPLDFRAVELDDDGMLGAWQALSRSATIDHCIAQLQASGGGPGHQALASGLYLLLQRYYVGGLLSGAVKQ
jgi:hypothetical protein